jgi:hypothetical protein
LRPRGSRWTRRTRRSKDLTTGIQTTIEKIEADEPYKQENEIKELLPDHGAPRQEAKGLVRLGRT